MVEFFSHDDLTIDEKVDECAETYHKKVCEAAYLGDQCYKVVDSTSPYNFGVWQQQFYLHKCILAIYAW